MIQIISGVKGKGKTKFLIQKANEAVKAANGSVVYLDKNNKHMYELSNRIRLINVGDFPIDTYDAFIGFICGLISQDKLILFRGNEMAPYRTKTAEIPLKYFCCFLLNHDIISKL